MRFDNDHNDIPLWVWIIAGVIITLLILQPTESRADEMLAKDKQQHIAVSALIAIPAAMYLEDTDHPVLYGIAVAMIPGALKEIYDAAHPKTHTASTADLAADFVGAASGALIGHGIALHVSRGSTSVTYTSAF